MNYISRFLIVYAALNLFFKLIDFIANSIDDKMISYRDIAETLIAIIVIAFVAGFWHSYYLENKISEE